MPDHTQPGDPRPHLPPEATIDQALVGTPVVDGADTLLATSGSRPTAAPVEVPDDLKDHPRYRVIRPLGQGGMGAVYLAEHVIMGRRVALKVIHPRFTSSEAAVERFRREVRSAARLSHPNIVTAHDAEQAGRTHFLVMEFVEGQSLGQILSSRTPLTVPQACACARQVALGLQHAHERGMVHRDVKPDNLMLTPDGVVKILDFGLARLGSGADLPADATGGGDGRLTVAGSVLGTPDYVAPEQIVDAQGADIRADLYSLGCTLYHLLTRHLPFPERSIAEKFLAHAQRRPQPLARWRPGLPDGLAEVVERLMAKRPEDRYQTPAEAAEALAPFAAPDPTGAPDDGPRHAWVVAVAVGAAVALLALGWWLRPAP